MILFFFILFLIVAVLALIIYYFRNKQVAHYHTTQIITSSSSKPLTFSSESDADQTPLNTVFHRFNHASYKEWLLWISRQDAGLRQIAFEKLVDHLLGPPKHWGFITHEVLHSIAGFRTQESFEVLVKFFRLTRRMWNDYKSVPRYYGISAKLLVELDPDKGLVVLNQEFKEVSSVHQSIEKKQCILSALSSLPDKSKIKSFMIELVSDKEEPVQVRSKALGLIESFSEKDKLEAFREILDSFYIRNKIKMENSDNFTFQEFSRKVVNFIGSSILNAGFAKILHSRNLAPILVASIQELISKNNNLSSIKLFTIAKVNNNLSETLSLTLAQNAAFTNTEREAFLGELTPVKLDYEYLTGITEEFCLPIPRANEVEYNHLKDLLLQSAPNTNNSKSKAGLMLIGSADYKKLYYTKAVSLERRWRFLYINAKEVLTKENFSQLHGRLNEIPKPCVIFVDNISLLFKDDDTAAASPRQKLLQALQIQALDKRCFIAGSVPPSLFYSKEASSINLIQRMENNLLPNAFDVDQNEEEISKNLLKNLIMQLSSSRFENEKSGERFIDEIEKEYKGSSSLEIYFHAVRNIQYMLFAFKQLCPLDKVKLYEDKFNDLSDQSLHQEHLLAQTNETNNQEKISEQELKTSTSE
jgi:hypothetical protein